MARAKKVGIRSKTKTVDFSDFVARWNEIQELETPEMHFRIARWLSARWAAGERELLLLAFRNSGKSTLVGLFAAWLLACDPNLRILILSADHALARKMARNVKRIVERHPLSGLLRPTRADEWAADRFTVARDAELRDPSVLARGIGGNVTGSRADVVICDDVEVPNTCDTAGKRQDLRERLDEIEFILNPGGLRLFIGTPHTYYSIYADAPRPEADEERPYLAEFVRLEIPVLDATGRSAWPERFSPAKLEAARRRSGPAKFSSQMMLQFVNAAEARLDPARMGSYEGELIYSEGNGEATLTLEGRRLVSVSCWWDPAYGASDRGDASALAALFTDEDGRHLLHRIEYLVHSGTAEPSETSEAVVLCRQVAAFARDLHIPAVRIEINGIGHYLPGLLRGEIRALGMTCAVIEETSRRPKDARILEAFDVALASGRLAAHRSVWRSPFIAEMREWRSGGRGRDDGLDAVAGCLLSEPVRLPRRPQIPASRSRPRLDWRPGGGQHMAVMDFET